jgi:hypothetical protein
MSPASARPITPSSPRFRASLSGRPPTSLSAHARKLRPVRIQHGRIDVESTMHVDSRRAARRSRRARTAGEAQRPWRSVAVGFGRSVERWFTTALGPVSASAAEVGLTPPILPTAPGRLIERATSLGQRLPFFADDLRDRGAPFEGSERYDVSGGLLFDRLLSMTRAGDRISRSDRTAPGPATRDQNDSPLLCARSRGLVDRRSAFGPMVSSRGGRRRLSGVMWQSRSIAPCPPVDRNMSSESSGPQLRFVDSEHGALTR